MPFPYSNDSISYYQIMKNISIILLFLLSFGIQFSSIAQSKGGYGDDCHTELTPEELSQIIGGNQYYNVFRIDGKGGKVTLMEFNLVMKAGQHYFFSIQSAAGGADGIVMRVYDRITKKRVFSNAEGGSPNANFSYQCDKTGMYDVKFSFQKSQNYCGVCVCSYR